MTMKNHTRTIPNGTSRLRRLLPLALALLALCLWVSPNLSPARAAGLTGAIYLNGATGDDANDGSSAALAVKTFARAKELATLNSGISDILVTGSVPVSGEVSLAGTNAVLKREASFTGTLLRVASGQTATFRDITIDGNAAEAANVQQSLVSNSGTLNIEGGAVLQNNQMGSSAYVSQGGAINSTGGTINMTGGVIQNNTATMGGGIKLSGGATLNMSSGVIQNNETLNGPDMVGFRHAGAGGGVCMINGATFNLSGGLIQNNTAAEIGGGISIGAMEVSFGHNRLNMTGGTIDGNASGATGGGIFVQAPLEYYASAANISAGYITNNQMLGTGVSNFRFGGGGIYVNGFNYPGYTNGQLNLSNVLITDNEAVEDGGGYAACPITNTKIYLTNGSAIFGNRAENARDVYIYANPFWGTHGGYPDYEISSTMLGGVPYRWLYPDGTEVPLTLLNGTLVGTSAEFNLETEAVANESTLALAKVFITGNTSATKGGGIGSNGDLNIGVSDQFTQLAISKTWDDWNNAAGLRPSVIEVEVWRKLKDTTDAPEYVGFDRVRPDPVSGAWSLVIPLLPADDGHGRLYEYSLKERPVNSYDTEVTGTEAEGFVVANKLNATTQVPVRKAWSDADDQDGVRPQSVTVALLADSADTGITLTLNDGNGWAGAFTDLDKYSNGQLIFYSVEEVPVGNGYTWVTTGDAAAGYIITNSRTPETTSVPVKKAWDDANNQDGVRPASVIVSLLADKLDTGKTLTLNEGNSWAGAFTNLDKYKAGKLIAYTVKETPVGNGYMTVITGDAATGYTVTNSRAPETITIAGEKFWDDQDDLYGVRPAQITVNLYANYALLPDKTQVVTADSEGRWTWTWTDLPKYAGGKAIVYEIGEARLADYLVMFPDYESAGLLAYDIRNRYAPDLFNIPVRKYFDDQANAEGLRPVSITVRLFANGQDTGKTVVLNEANHWYAIFADLDKYDQNQEAIRYRLEESLTDGLYTTTYRPATEMTVDQLNHVDARSGATIRNTRVPETISVSGSKTWLDQGDQDGKRPQSITVRLLRNGTEIDARTVTAADGWAWQFTGLLKFVGGQEATYTITEDTVPGYTTQVNDYDIANSHTPERLDIPVKKVWQDGNDQDGARPLSVTVRLLADTVDTGKTLVLNAGNNWAGAFSNLDKFKDGQLIDYTVAEVPDENGYTFAVTGFAAAGFTLTNTRVPETITVSGSKTWADNNNQGGTRPGSIVIHLMADGEELEARTVSQDTGWAWQFDKLPRYKAGQEIAYTILEGPVPLYRAVVDGFNVRNELLPPEATTELPPLPTPVPTPTPTYPTLRVPLEISKTLMNGRLEAGRFVFQLRDRNGRLLAEAVNEADGSVRFPDRTFSHEVSDWIYTIHEVAGQEKGITYDTAVYTVRITTRAVDGQLKASVSLQKDGTPYSGAINFVNRLDMPPTGDSAGKTLGWLLLAALGLGLGGWALDRRRRRGA